jgi:Rrf2 family iron-sulfur cluster assembly transcriptional regulator
MLPPMRLSLQVQYAICGVFDLAYNGQGGPVQVRVISDRQAIPARYLEQIFRRLRQAAILSSKRGPGGGYTLARRASDISLRQVVEAVEGPLDETLVMEPEPEDCAFRPRFLWSHLAERFGEVLGETTIDGLCREAERVEVPRIETEAPMYFI